MSAIITIHRSKTIEYISIKRKRIQIAYKYKCCTNTQITIVQIKNV